MDLQLEGKRALVTGGSRGIGRAVARSLAGEGADVVLAARGGQALDEAASAIAAESGRRIPPIVVDTTDDAAVRAMAAEAERVLGGIDILVNCAARAGGQAPTPRLGDLEDDAARVELETKVLGYLRTARALAPGMVARGWGRIINVSGLAARQSGSIMGSIRNVAVAALTKNLADELAGSGVNVTVVHPGTTVTEATRGVVAARARAAGLDETEIERRMGSGTAVGRLITADEVAAVVTFLASPLSVAINGDAIACGGGALGPIHY